jgi:hypothetical protein
MGRFAYIAFAEKTAMTAKSHKAPEKLYDTRSEDAPQGILVEPRTGT